MDMKNNKETGCDGIPAEARKTLIIKDEVTEIFTKSSDVIKSKRQFPRDWKLH
jgi:hypothetical protein